MTTHLDDDGHKELSRKLADVNKRSEQGRGGGGR